MLLKFLDSSHIDSLLGGSIRFGRLQYYQLLEAITGDRTIGDRREGSSTHSIDPILVGPESSERDRAYLARLGIKVEGSAKLVVSGGGQFREDVDAYVFCLSDGDSGALSEAMTSNSGRTSYDACVEIVDIERLCLALRTARVREYNQRVDELFGQPVGGPIQYQDPPPSTPRLVIDPSPFRKSPDYAYQSEYRIVLPNDQHLRRDHVTVEISPEGIFRELFRSTRCETARVESADILVAGPAFIRECRSYEQLYEQGAQYRLPMNTMMGALLRAYWTVRGAGFRSLTLDHSLISLDYPSNALGVYHGSRDITMRIETALGRRP